MLENRFEICIALFKVNRTDAAVLYQTNRSRLYQSLRQTAPGQFHGTFRSNDISMGKMVAQQKKFVAGLLVAGLIKRQHLHLYRASGKITNKLNSDFQWYLIAPRAGELRPLYTRHGGATT